MRILFCHETYYTQRQDGTVYSYGAFPYELWERRFLPYFEHVTVVGRKKKLGENETGVLDVSSGRNVEHVLLPNIHSPLKRFTKSGRMYKKIKDQVERADAVVIRGPVDFGMMAARAARACGKPYAIEMCGCAYDRAFYKSDMVGKLYAPFKYRRAQKMVMHADAVMYVTENFLQARYPTNGLEDYASNVEISMPPDHVLENRMARIAQDKAKITIGLIGNFESGLKGIGMAVDALGIVQKYYEDHKDSGLPDFELKILGQSMAALWQSAIKEKHLEGKVEFCGRIPSGDAVMEWLDAVDIFVKPSLHEGLPRPVIEAMSRGCTVLSSDAGGASELLEAGCIYPRGEVSVLADQIIEFMVQSKRAHMAKVNFNKAKEYTTETLVARRHEFWQEFSDIVLKNKLRASKK